MNFGSGPPILLPTLDQLWALALMAVGIALLARAARLIWKDLRLRRMGRTAKGHVVRVISGHESDKLVVGFTDFQGRAHQFETDLSQISGTFPVGAPVGIRYDPNRPERAHLADQPISRAFICLLLLVGGVSVTWVGNMMWRTAS